jgi:hypothetical protein
LIPFEDAIDRFPVVVGIVDVEMSSAMLSRLPQSPLGRYPWGWQPSEGAWDRFRVHTNGRLCGILISVAGLECLGFRIAAEMVDEFDFI